MNISCTFQNNLTVSKQDDSFILRPTQALPVLLYKASNVDIPQAQDESMRYIAYSFNVVQNVHLRSGIIVSQ